MGVPYPVDATPHELVGRESVCRPIGTKTGEEVALESDDIETHLLVEEPNQPDLRLVELGDSVTTLPQLDDAPVPSFAEITAASEALTGRIQQRPPAFSALKVAGRRAYDLARRGESPEIKPRAVTVYRFCPTAYEYPRLEVEVECGSGTYVRSLGRDLALSLGTAAVMSQLERTSIGTFAVGDAVDPEALTRDSWIRHLLPMLSAVRQLPQVELSDLEVARIAAGRTIDRRPPARGVSEFAGVDSAGRLRAILTPRGRGLLGRMLPAGSVGVQFDHGQVGAGAADPQHPRLVGLHGHRPLRP